MRTLPLLALVATVAACSGGRAGSVNPVRLFEPSVRLHHVAVRNLGLAGGTLDLALAFHNPNQITLQGTRVMAGLDIEGTHFGDVDLSNPFTLAGRDTTILTLPLTFKWSGVGAAARSVLNYGAVNYGIRGRFGVDLPTGGALEVPFSGEGSVPLLKP